MFRRYSRALPCALAALAVLVILQPASAQVTFYADFEDAVGVNDPAQWVPDNAGQAWGIADFPGSGQGLKQLNEGCGNSGNTPLPGVENFTDGIIQLDMSWEDDDSWGVIFRKTADDAGYIVFFGYIETPSVIIGDLANGCAPDGTCLDSTTCEGGGGEIIMVDHGLGAALTMDLSVSYTGRVEVKGDTIKVWYLPTASIADPLGDLGDPLVEIQDSAHAGPGSVGIWHESQGGSMIDNVLILGFSAGLATNPSPANGAVDVIRDSDFTWSPGEFAQTHDVYLGTTFDDVNDASASDPGAATVEAGLTDASFDPGRLEFGQTYYWRVDEVNGPPDNAILKGDVWSFTVEPFAYPVENIIPTTTATSAAGEEIANIINGSGLNDQDQHSVEATDMWLGNPVDADPVTIQFEFDRLYKLHQMLVWNYNVMFEPLLNFGLKDVTVEYSENGTDWTALGDVEFAQATAKSDYTANTTIDFGGVPAKLVRLTINANHGMLPQYGLSELRFLYIPAHAREPQPDDGDTDVAVGTTLAWRAGREAATHDVYLGTAADDLALADSVTANSYSPATLEFGGTYFWRVDEVNEAEAISLWEGSLWSFATEEFAVIDDMESYNDDDNRIYDTWLDGFANGTGSTVGYFEAPFAERTIVNSGSQSMPLEYANDAAPFYSEAELDLGSLNLDTNGADTLRLFVAGQAPAFLETADGTIIMNAIGTDIWDAADEFRYVYRQLTGNGSMTARVDYLDASPNSWAKGGAMIRQSTEPGAINTYMAMTGGDGGGATYQQRMDADAASVSQHTYADGPFAPPYWVRVTREGDTLLGYTSPDGENWTQRGDVVTLAMTDPVLIGLALTSHNASQATSAEFSNVSFTGNVSAGWEMAEVGVAQPVGNDPALLYVALEDTSGSVAVVTHPDESIVARSGWTEWAIPYSDLTGVNLGRVAIMYIGVGDRDNPTADGAGLIFVDDVGYGTPAPVAE